jgi:hypothetical protein
MASPSAAASLWVRQEIRWWLTHRSAETLFIGWTDGTLVWDADRRRSTGRGPTPCRARNWPAPSARRPAGSTCAGCAARSRPVPTRV